MPIPHEHKEFVQQLTGGKFFEIPGDRRLLALSIIPKNPSAEPLVLHPLEYELRRGLSPLGSRRYDDKRRDQAYANIAYEWDEGKPIRVRSAIEIRPSGSVFAAELLREIEISGAPTIPFYVHEEQLIKAMAEYTKCMAVHCHIPQPFYCVISLLNTTGAIFSTTDAWIGEVPRDFVASELHLPAVELPSDLNLQDYNNTVSEMAKLLHPAFIQIWNEAGLPSDPYYDADGNFLWR